MNPTLRRAPLADAAAALAAYFGDSSRCSRRAAVPARRVAVDRRLLRGALDLVHAPRAAGRRRRSRAVTRGGRLVRARRRLRSRRVDASSSSEDALAIAAGARAHAPTSVVAGRASPPATRSRSLRRLCPRRDRRNDRRPRPRRGRDRARATRARDRVHVHFPRIGFHIKAVKKDMRMKTLQGRHGRHHRRRLGLRPRDLAPRRAARHERRHGRRAAGRARSRRRRDRARSAPRCCRSGSMSRSAAEVEALGAATAGALRRAAHRLQQRRRRRRRADLGEHASPTGSGCSASTSWASPTASASSRR